MTSRPRTAKTVDLIDDGAEVKRWIELDAYLGTMLNVMDGFVLVWIIVIFLALSFGLVNTLVMAVFERVSEIGLMLALGMRPINILGQIIVESLLLLAIGLAIGSGLGLGGGAADEGRCRSQPLSAKAWKCGACRAFCIPSCCSAT